MVHVGAEIDKDLREKFNRLVRFSGKTAASVITRFIEKYVEKNAHILEKMDLITEDVEIN